MSSNPVTSPVVVGLSTMDLKSDKSPLNPETSPVNEERSPDKPEIYVIRSWFQVPSSSNLR